MQVREAEVQAKSATVSCSAKAVGQAGRSICQVLRPKQSKRRSTFKHRRQWGSLCRQPGCFEALLVMLRDFLRMDGQRQIVELEVGACRPVVAADKTPAPIEDHQLGVQESFWRIESARYALFVQEGKGRCVYDR